jgi:hypothetical protein
MAAMPGRCTAWARKGPATGKQCPGRVAALAALAQTMGKDLAEADWWRILDALLLIASHPANS